MTSDISTEDILKLMDWVDQTMPSDEWIPVNEKQLEVFKHLISEYYGWPDFTLNINKAGDKVMKVKI